MYLGCLAVHLQLAQVSWGRGPPPTPWPSLRCCEDASAAQSPPSGTRLHKAA